MTLREALKTAKWLPVIKFINKKDCDNIFKSENPSIQNTTDSYIRVFNELIYKPKVKAYKMSWLVKESIDPFDKKKYIDVCFLNPDYIAPKKGLLPWGGKNPPKGHYNCNDNKHSKEFAAGFTPWSKIIDTPIINKTKYSLERVVAEILWEITFYGFSEQKVKSTVSKLYKSLDKSIKEVKSGKCITLPKKSKSGFDIVIPNNVFKQIKKNTK